MTAPILIWTFRRTGGTTLAGLVGHVAGRAFVHEPFNQSRDWHPIVERFLVSKNQVVLRRDLRDALARRRNIKHCHDFLPVALHATLLEEAVAAGYAHVVLDRRADLDRVISLELARQTGAWGPRQAGDRYPDILAGRIRLEPLSLGAVEKQLQAGQRRRVGLADRMEALGIVPHVVYFEDLFGPQADGPARVGELLAFLGLDPLAVSDFESQQRRALVDRAQNTNRILEQVPGLETLRGQVVTDVSPDAAWGRFSNLPGHGEAL